MWQVGKSKTGSHWDAMNSTKSGLWVGSSVFYKWTLRLRLVIEWRQEPCIWPVPEHFGGNELSEPMMRCKDDSLKIPKGSLWDPAKGSQEHLKVNLVFNSSGVRRPGCKPQPWHCQIWDFGYTTHHPSFITDFFYYLVRLCTLNETICGEPWEHCLMPSGSPRTIYCYYCLESRQPFTLSLSCISSQFSWPWTAAPLPPWSVASWKTW